MTESYYIGAYWRSGKEEVASCAQRTEACLRKLSQIDRTFEQWFTLGQSRKAARKERIVIDRVALQDLLRRGRNRRDDNKEVIRELGFALAGWNGEPEGEAAGFSLVCGSFSASGILNSFLLDLPRIGPSSIRLQEEEIAKELVKAVAIAWEPDWAGLLSRSYLETIKFDASLPTPGWVLYLPQPLDHAVLPPLFTKEDGPRGGSIIIAKERFTGTPKHIEAANALISSLASAGWR